LVAYEYIILEDNEVSVDYDYNDKSSDHYSDSSTSKENISVAELDTESNIESIEGKQKLYITFKK
jgi:hypothetical protein